MPEAKCFTSTFPPARRHLLICSVAVILLLVFVLAVSANSIAKELITNRATNVEESLDSFPGKLAQDPVDTWVDKLVNKLYHKMLVLCKSMPSQRADVDMLWPFRGAAPGARQLDKTSSVAAIDPGYVASRANPAQPSKERTRLPQSAPIAAPAAGAINLGQIVEKPENIKRVMPPATQRVAKDYAATRGFKFPPKAIPPSSEETKAARETYAAARGLKFLPLRWKPTSNKMLLDSKDNKAPQPSPLIRAARAAARTAAVGAIILPKAATLAMQKSWQQGTMAARAVTRTVAFKAASTSKLLRERPSALKILKKPPGIRSGPRLEPPKKIAVDNDLNNLKNIVSHSARMIAASRALESQRPDALVVDPLASIFAGNAIDDSMVQKIAPRIAIRTRYFDDVIQSFLDNSAKADSSVQVVHLGAGMDSRPFRLDAPRNTTYYELDNEDVVALKEGLLHRALGESPETRDMIMSGNSKRRTVACNLELNGGTGWKSSLLRAGFDPTKPTCWVLEGFTYYIRDETTMCGIFSTMRQISAPGSLVIASVISLASLRVARAAKTNLAQSWKWGSDRPDQLLSNCGWKCGPSDVVFPPDDRANYGRSPPSPGEFKGDAEGRKGVMYVTAKC